MVPSQSFFRGKFEIIRPLAFVGKEVVKGFARDKKFPDFVNPCPSSKTSKRQEIKNLLKQLYSSNKKIRGNIFHAMSHVKKEYLLQ